MTHRSFRTRWKQFVCSITPIGVGYGLGHIWVSDNNSVVKITLPEVTVRTTFMECARCQKTWPSR